MKQENILIVFTKNLIYGKVKTRLAATIGNDKAYQVYKDLITHTHFVAEQLPCDKIVYYSEHIEAEDIWGHNYLKTKQRGTDLGERMMNAFYDIFQHGYFKAVIIGTDCATLNADLIINAFEQLNNQDVVIGPSLDGGYYLLGMKILHQTLFENIAWSTGTVFDTTLAACNYSGLSYYLLPALNDVDEEKDLEDLRQINLI
jgi:rSAM/selenodomain-associated transferase 1